MKSSIFECRYLESFKTPPRCHHFSHYLCLSYSLLLFSDHDLVYNYYKLKYWPLCVLQDIRCKIQCHQKYNFEMKTKTPLRLPPPLLRTHRVLLLPQVKKQTNNQAGNQQIVLSVEKCKHIKTKLWRRKMNLH